MLVIKRTKAAVVGPDGIGGPPATHWAAVVLPGGAVDRWTASPDQAKRLDDQAALAVLLHYEDRPGAGQIEAVDPDQQAQKPAAKPEPRAGRRGRHYSEEP